MPPRAQSLLAAAAIAAVAVATIPACVESGCHITPYCEGNTMHACRIDYDTGSWEEKTNCAFDGRVCRQSADAVACVFPDRPCAADACTGDQIASCTPLGLVGSMFDCTSDEPGRTCFDDGPGPPTCGYPQINCPGAGANTLCGPDGVSLYSGCQDEPHPIYRYDCSSDGNVCTTANGLAGCALPTLVPCDDNYCSADLTTAYTCGVIGLLVQADDCAARGQICRAGWCEHR